MANIITKLFEKFVNILPENATRTSADDPGLTIKTSPLLWPYEIFVLEWERRTLMRDLDLMVKRDSRIDRANYVMANGATRGGITVTVGSGRTEKVRKSAQTVIDKLMKDCKINAHLPAWARTILRDGDIFLNIIPRVGPDGRVYISRIKNLPAISLERQDDMTDNFPDLKQAFMQVDPITRQAIQTFPLWTINHMRWKYDPGERYGRSQYYSGRPMWKKLQMTEEDLVVRRRTRAVQRRAHIIGTADNPGDEKDINKYKSQNRLDDPKNAKVTTDYFINGQGDIKNLEGDAHLDHIKDVEYLLENAMIGTGVPLHILGFGRNVNRDVVEDQKQTYKEDMQGLQDILEHGDPGPFSGLRSIFNMALALEGINPEDVSINVRWTRINEMTFGETVDNVMKLRAAQPKPMITEKLGLSMMGKHLDLDDEKAIEDELKAIDAEIASDKQAQAVEAANVNPEKPTPSSIARSTLSTAGKPNLDSLHSANPLHSERMSDLEKSIADDVRGSFSAVAEKMRTEAGLVKMIKLMLDHVITDSLENESGLTSQNIELLKTYTLNKFDQFWEQEENALTNKMFSSYKDAARMAEDMLHHDVRIGVDFQMVSREVLDALKTQGGYRIRGIQNTTRKAIVQAISEAYANSDKTQGYVDRIATAIEAPDWRIKTIARTEMAYAFNMANLKYQMLAGYTKFRWVAVMDNRTCPKCAARNGNTYDIMDVSSPPIHPNCRCILIPVS